MAPLSTDRVSAFEQLQLRSSLIGNTFYKTLGGGSQSCRAWCLCGRLARSHQCRRRIDVSTNISFFDLCLLIAHPNKQDTPSRADTYMYMHHLLSSIICCSSCQSPCKRNNLYLSTSVMTEILCSPESPLEH